MPVDILRRFGQLITPLTGCLACRNDETSGCNSITGYKMKLLNHVRAEL